METTTRLLDDATVIERIFDHIDHETTDLGETTWREPVEHYRSEARFATERDAVLRRFPVGFCPSAALPEAGSYVARDAAGTPIVVARGNDGCVRAFRNACRHRGAAVAAGPGCAKAFVCRYHGWTYGLDGRLIHVPHEHGFPGLEKGLRGLVPVAAAEVGGVVFVTQDAPLADTRLQHLPQVIPPSYRLIARSRKLENRCRELSRGLSHPHDSRSDVLSRPIRQPERRRDVWREQPGNLPVSRHPQAPLRAARGTLRRR
jgi:nitrite reductase/ring-hydroxylating ferredoxin subunit